MPVGFHQPVMLAEVLAALKPRAGGRYLDGTIGGGGHAEAILEASKPDGFLYGCDRDGEAIEAARKRLEKYAGRWELRQGNFADVGGWVPANSLDGAVLDLGVSSMQLDTPERGFSIQHEGELDMRFNQREGLTAREVVNNMPEEELERIFRELGGEPQARRFARAIVEERRKSPIVSTRQLADLVARVSRWKGGRVHPATRVMQALRMHVNNEIESLRAGLEAVLGVLKPGGVMAVICFHGGEVRVVRQYFDAEARDYEAADGDVPELRKPKAPRVRWVHRKAVFPTAEEVESNRRSRSATLRVIEKL